MKDARQSTCQLLDLARDGLVSWEMLARDLLNWMSEAEVKNFAEDAGYFNESNQDY